MKVLHFKSNFLNPSETFIHRFIANHQDFEPVAMCNESLSFTDGLQVYEKPRNGIAGGINTLCFHLNWRLPFYDKTIKKVQADIIHAHFGFDGYRMISPAHKNNTPLIVSFYGSDVSRLPTEFDWPRRYRKLARQGDAFIAISQLMKRQLIALGFPKEKITIIPFGINLEQFSYHPTLSTQQRLMMVGRMVPKKGFEYALEAIKLLHEQGKSVHLDLYGDGILRDQLEQQAKEWGIEGLVHFYGLVSEQEVCKAQYRHDALLAPSVWAKDGDAEGLPNTILEAMACGTPVIAADHAAINEVIASHQTGMLVPQRNAAAIANAIQHLFEHPREVSKMQEQAHALIKKEYEIGKVVSRLESLYKQVIAQHAG